MELCAELLKEHSRRQMLQVAGYVGDDPERFGELMRLFLSDEYRVVQRAAWVVSTVAERHPTLIRPYLPRLVKALEDDTAHPSVHRNVMRLLQWAPIPKRYEGRLYDICIGKIDDPTAPTAVRAFATSTRRGLSSPAPTPKKSASKSSERRQARGGRRAPNRPANGQGASGVQIATMACGLVACAG